MPACSVCALLMTGAPALLMASAPQPLQATRLVHQLETSQLSAANMCTLVKEHVKRELGELSIACDDQLARNAAVLLSSLAILQQQKHVPQQAQENYQIWMHQIQQVLQQACTWYRRPMQLCMANRLVCGVCL